MRENLHQTEGEMTKRTHRRVSILFQVLILVAIFASWWYRRDYVVLIEQKGGSNALPDTYGTSPDFLLASKS